jgi:hypothetical protein
MEVGHAAHPQGDLAATAKEWEQPRTACDAGAGRGRAGAAMVARAARRGAVCRGEPRTPSEGARGCGSARRQGLGKPTRLGSGRPSRSPLRRPAGKADGRSLKAPLGGRVRTALRGQRPGAGVSRGSGSRAQALEALDTKRSSFPLPLSYPLPLIPCWLLQTPDQRPRCYHRSMGSSVRSTPSGVPAEGIGAVGCRYPVGTRSLTPQGARCDQGHPAGHRFSVEGRRGAGRAGPCMASLRGMSRG